jgi:hypothetical protein
MEVLHRLGQTKQLAIGGLVPHLLSSEGAQRRQTILMLRRIRREFPGQIRMDSLHGVQPQYVTQQKWNQTSAVLAPWTP